MDLSIIVLNFNTKDLTLTCLSSIFKETRSIDFEVILVDNGSTDGSIEAIRQEFPQVRLTENKENRGFAKGNNQGIEIAQGKYILLLNSDTVVLGSALQKTVTWMEDHPGVGAASCRLLNDDRTIQPTGGYFPTLGRLFAWMLFIDDLPIFRNIIRPYHYRNQNIPINQDNIFNNEHEQDWITGAFMMIRKEVIGKVGKLDDQYFMYFEEVEWCYRIKKAGWKIAFTPTAQIIHLGQKSSINSSVGSPTGLLGEYRGIKEFYRTYFPGQQIFASLGLRLGALLRVILWGIIKRRKDAIKIYAEAFRLA